MLRDITSLRLSRVVRAVISRQSRGSTTQTIKTHVETKSQPDAARASPHDITTLLICAGASHAPQISAAGDALHRRR